MDGQVAVGLATLVVLTVTLVAYGIQARHFAHQTRLLTEQIAISNKHFELTSYSTRAGASMNINATMNGLSFMFIERPHLRPYIYGRAHVPDEEPLRSTVLAVAEMYVDLMASLLDNQRLITDEQHEGWQLYFRDLARNSPSIRYQWQQTRDWYEPPMRDLLDPVVFPDGPPESRRGG